MAGLVTLILVVSTISQMVSIVQLEDNIVETLQPTQIYLQSLQSDIQESMYISSSRFEEDKTQRRLNWNNIWDNDIQFSLDSLRKLRADWKSSQSTDAYRRLEKSILEMKPLQNDCMVFLNRSERFGLPPGEEYYLARDRLIGLNETVKGQIESLMGIQRTAAEKDQQLVLKEMRRFRSTEIVLLFIAFTVGIVIAWVVARSILLQIRKTRDTLTVLSEGNLPESIPHFDNELKEIIHSIEVLVENFKSLKTFALQVEKGDYGNTVAVFEKQGELGEVLEQMRSSLQEVSTQENRRSWQNKGISEFVDVLRDNNDDLNKLGDDVINKLTKYLNCNQGGIYIVDDTDAPFPTLMLIAYYAFEKKKFLRQTFDSREGLIGQAYQEKKLIHLTEIPDDYGLITSGVGGARPKSVIISPLIINDVIFGIIELASFTYFEDYQVEFVSKISENIAATFSNVRMNVRTRKLLETSQQQAEQMRAQEEEMRQNVEELQATQEEMRRKATLLEMSEARGKAFFDGAINPILFLGSDGKIEEMNSSAEKMFNQKVDVLKGKYFNDLVSEDFKSAIGKMVHAHALHNSSLKVDFYLRESVIGGTNFYIAYLRDVTAYINEQKVLHHKQQALQDQIKSLEEQIEYDSKNAELVLNEQAQNFDIEITQLKEYIIQWKNHNEYLNSLLDNIPTAIAWKDASLKFAGANIAFLHLAGIVSSDYIIGQNHESMPWAEHAEGFRNIEQEIWLNGNTYQEPVNGSVEHSTETNFTWIPVKNKSNEVTAILIVKQAAAIQESDDKLQVFRKEIEKVKRAIKTIAN